MSDEPRYAIGDLADLGGVSRRTVRYYVQEGLLPTPLGVGRGNHYGREHLDQLLRVKALQEEGRTLGEIRQALDGTGDNATERLESPRHDAQPLLPRAVWRRVTLAPGVELHVAADAVFPSESKLADLASWWRHGLPGAASAATRSGKHDSTEKEEENDA